MNELHTEQNISNVHSYNVIALKSERKVINSVILWIIQKISAGILDDKLSKPALRAGSF